MTTPDPAPTPRDAATLILVREDDDAPRVLMGQRGSAASFMPSKFVFPGGALSPGDRALTGLPPLRPACAARLERHAPPGLGPALAAAAIRETLEETGLALGRPGPAPAGEIHPDWRPFFDRGLTPSTDRLTFVFRAVTPPYRPKRFDARFFVGSAADVEGDLDDFSAADAELSHLSWLTLPEARRLELPLITEVVLAEVEDMLRARAAGETGDRPAPYFHHDHERSWFDAL